jgi:hypothetical protein
MRGPRIAAQVPIQGAMTMNTKTRSKLVLRRETLQSLSDGQLDGVAGGINSLACLLTIQSRNCIKRLHKIHVNDTVYRPDGNPPAQNDTVYRGGGKVIPV